MNVHLAGLYVVLELGKTPHESTSVLQRAGNHKKDFMWLEPPRSSGAITVVDVHSAADATEHAEKVQCWARSVWEAWAPHHKMARRWAELSI